MTIDGLSAPASPVVFHEERYNIQIKYWICSQLKVFGNLTQIRK